MECVVGVTHVGGDMFESIPAADAIFMKVNFIFSLIIYNLIFFFDFYNKYSVRI